MNGARHDRRLQINFKGEPSDLGFPSKFDTFRSVQRELADFCLNGPDPDLEARRFIAASVPTGSGKSLGAQLIGKLYTMARNQGMDKDERDKFVVLTATKALEDQVERDGFDLIDIRGRKNYPCMEGEWDCDEGADYDCKHADKPNCTYNAQVRHAGLSVSVLSNYQYWMSVRGRNLRALEGKFKRVGLLICDEAHKVFDELARFLGTWVSNADLHKWANDEIRALIQASGGAEWDRVSGVWIDALEMAYVRIVSKQADIESRYESEAAAWRSNKEYRKLERLANSLERVVSHGRDGNWLWRHTKSGIAFDCIWPARYSERYLWSGVPNVVLISATLRPKLLHLLGVQQHCYWFREWGRVFLPQHSPVYWVPTGKMGHKAKEEERLQSVRRLDEIWEEWGIRGQMKGIVHTNSYARAEWTQTHSRYGKAMILSKSGGDEAGAAAARYRESQEPVMLVSPSFAEGWDFPEEDCGWQVISKVPFADRSDPVVLARCESDREYYDCDAMQKLVQACGRKTRRENQRCLTMITDDAVALQGHSRYGLRVRAKKYAPTWFKVMDSPGGQVPKAWTP
jgi:Rad3-related DNA helicase